MTRLPLLISASAIALAACEPVTTTDGAAVTVTTPGTTAAPAGADLSPPPGLTREEMTIWNSMTDGAKAEAKAFIAGGGTFRDFYSV